MIVILINKLSNGDEAHLFGGIACDVEGCETFEPPFNGDDRRTALIERGWFIEPGKHRCPEHFHTDAPSRGPDRRVTDVISKRI